MDKTDEGPLYVETCDSCGTGIPASQTAPKMLAGDVRLFEFSLNVYPAEVGARRNAYYGSPLMRQSYRVLLCDQCAVKEAHRFMLAASAIAVGE